jgi:hypothetical protein
LTEGSDRLQNALSSSKPTKPEDIPPKAEERLIPLDAALLQPTFYGTGPWFEPAAPENPLRRPPTILTLDEAVAEPAFVPIDTYLFKGKNFDDVLALRDPNKGNPNNAGGRKNPYASRYQGAGGALPTSSSFTGAGRAALQRTSAQFSNSNMAMAAMGIQGFDDKPDYKTAWVPFGNSGSELLARQLRPARMVIIAGSFPYKKQLLEFQNKLHLKTVQEVFDDTVEMVNKETDKKEKMDAFRFLGVQVERREVDVSGNPVAGEAGKWVSLPLAESYKIWLLNSGPPPESDDPKYDPVKCPGLRMPRLREFHAERSQDQMSMGGRPGMPGMPAPPPGASAPGREMPREEAPKAGESKYPDVAGKLKFIQDTLAKLEGQNVSKLATLPRTRAYDSFSPFDADTFSPATTDASANKPKKSDKAKKGEKDEEEDVIPEHVLVRLVDVNVEAGKSYRYRFKVRMTNPNYGKEDVASAAYKKDEFLESREWELPQTVTMPPETVYYAVDEKKISPEEKYTAKDKDNPLYDMWSTRNDPPSRDHYVVFQLHRWLEKTSIGGAESFIGDWAIADRVFVARGEFVGRTVKVDLPVWKFAQDSYVLPAEDQKRKRGGRVRSGVEVSFGQSNAENETILLDFEGGTVREGKQLSDNSSVEVLMLSPDGKLLARNSDKDAHDKERKDRRAKAQKHIKEIREGKAGGAAMPAGGGLDTK